METILSLVIDLIEIIASAVTPSKKSTTGFYRELSDEQVEMIKHASEKNRKYYWHIILIMILS